jgi:hypothetical protein
LGKDKLWEASNHPHFELRNLQGLISLIPKTNTCIIAKPVIHKDMALTIKPKQIGTQPKLRNKSAQKTKVLLLVFKFFGRFAPAFAVLQ